MFTYIGNDFSFRNTLRRKITIMHHLFCFYLHRPECQVFIGSSGTGQKTSCFSTDFCSSLVKFDVATNKFVINKVQIDDLGKFTSVIGGRISNDNADGNFLKYSSSAEYVRRVSQSDHGNVLSKRGGLSQYNREAYVH